MYVIEWRRTIKMNLTERRCDDVGQFQLSLGRTEWQTAYNAGEKRNLGDIKGKAFWLTPLLWAASFMEVVTSLMP
jgi:hypothetical protein